MARRKNLLDDASIRATTDMEYILRAEEKEKKRDNRQMVPVQKAIKEDRLIEVVDTRNVTRVLFISQDDSLLNPITQSLDGYLNLSDLFDEVHILILRQGIIPKFPVLQVAKNVWLYTAAGKTRWQAFLAGRQLVELQLVFAKGFRPDLIVALDPFESAWLTLQLSKKYERPCQLHVLVDFYTKQFKQSNRGSFLLRQLANNSIPRFESVRTASEGIFKKLVQKYNIPDISLLPRYQSYEPIIASQEKIDLKAKYPTFAFTILYIGNLDHNSRCFHAIDSARSILANYEAGLLVVGKGPNQSEFENRARVLHVGAEVVFVGAVNNTTPYLKSANVLLVTDTDKESDELVLKAAAAGIPMVMSVTEKRRDIFSDGESAFLCQPDDIQAFTGALNRLINNPELRGNFAKRGQEIILKQFHSDLPVYREAYRTSIEEALFVGDFGLSSDQI